MRKKIGESLIRAGLITDDDLRKALVEHKRSGERLGGVLVRLKFATERHIAKALASQLGFPYVDLTKHPCDPEAIRLITKEVALNRACVAIGLEGNLLTVAMADPLLFSVVQDLEFQTGHRIKQVVATRSEILAAIENGYSDRPLMRIVRPSAEPEVTPVATDPHSVVVRGRDEEVFDPLEGLRERSESDDIVNLVEQVVQHAIKSTASDVHVEPHEHGVLIRHRLDGLLKEAMDIPKWCHEGVIARLKIMAGMDIAEKRRPQDGRIRARGDDGVDVDFRVSTLRTLFGEKIVMRVLDHRKGVPLLEELGMSAAALEEVRRFLRHQHGMILAVGPTGSGKTTTLASALTSLRSERTNIVTIEDPIEYQIPGVNQTQIYEKIALTFASALRSILRQDPDVILVGEVRDAETARIAMQAAQTGHLVLSTLHTDDSPSCVTRLIDIGAEPFVIASGLLGVIAQRLVRRLCTHCRRQETPPADVLRMLAISDGEAATIPFYTAVGCDQCSQTGYRGRTGIYEVMPITEKLRQMIASHQPEDQIREAAIAGGMVTLGQDGLEKVKSGLTTAEELLRVVTEIAETRRACRGCGAGVAVDFRACPHCGTRVSDGCPHCARALQPGWKFCPYCSQSV